MQLPQDMVKWRALVSTIINNLKLSRGLNSIKSSRAHSRVNWLQVEINVSGTQVLRYSV
jgi:hypothetical protein